MSSARIPLAQPLTLDFNLVAVRNPERGRSLLAAASAAELAAVRSEVAALAAQLAAGLTSAGAGVPEHSHSLPEHGHLSLGDVVTVSEATHSMGVNAASPSAALEVRPPAAGGAALQVAASDGSPWLVVDDSGRVGVGVSGPLSVPMKVENPGDGATLRVEGPVTGGYATSGVVEVLNGGVVQGAFDGANVADGYGLFNFFGSPDATRFGELNFLDRSTSGDRRVCTFFVNSVSELRGEFGVVMRSSPWSFAYGLTINAEGQVIAGGNSPVTSTCFLEAASGFFHQAGDLGFFGIGPAGQQSLATGDVAFSCPAPGTPDYDFAATSGGYGFSSADEFNSCMAVLAALQSRINEMQSALQAYGLLA